MTSDEQLVNDFLAAKRQTQGDAVADAIKIETIGNLFRVTLPCKDLAFCKPFICNSELIQQMINDLYR